MFGLPWGCGNVDAALALSGVSGFLEVSAGAHDLHHGPFERFDLLQPVRGLGRHGLAHHRCRKEGENHLPALSPPLERRIGAQAQQVRVRVDAVLALRVVATEPKLGVADSLVGRLRRGYNGLIKHPRLQSVDWARATLTHQDPLQRIISNFTKCVKYYANRPSTTS